jgi:hypothetical protein
MVIARATMVYCLRQERSGTAVAVRGKEIASLSITKTHRLGCLEGVPIKKPAGKIQGRKVPMGFLQVRYL